MKYLAFRIDTTTIKENSVVSGWFVRGQDKITYDWPLIEEVESEEAAKELIRSLRTSDKQIIYNDGGYGISI